MSNMNYFEYDTPPVASSMLTATLDASPIAGLEAIYYQANPKLAQSLEQFFTDIRDRIQGYELNAREDYRKMVADLEKDFKPKGYYDRRINDIFKENMGYYGATLSDSAPSITPFDINDNAADYTAVGKILTKMAGREEIPDFLPLSVNNIPIPSPMYVLLNIGRLHPGVNKKADQIVAAFTEMARSFDPKTGHFSLDTAAVNGLKKYLKATVGIPIKTLINSLIYNNVYRNNLYINTPAISVREWTAIYLHECGHCMEMHTRLAENCVMGDLCSHTAKFANDTKKGAQLTSHTLQALNEAVSEVIKKTGNSESLENRTVSKVLESAANAAKKLETTSVPDSITRGLRYMFGIIFWMVVRWFVNRLFGIDLSTGLWYSGYEKGQAYTKTVRWGVPLVRILTGQYGVNPTIHGEKVSDIVNSSWTHSIGERAADTVASRFGYGPELMSGIQKLAPMFYTDPRDDKAIPRTSSNILNTINYCLTFVVTNLRLAPIIWNEDIHREGTRRIESILAEHYRFIRVVQENEPDTDPEYFKLMMTNTMKLRDLLAKAEKSVANWPIIKYVAIILRDFMEPGVIVDMIASGRLDNDYAKLGEQLEGITDSSLYYWSTMVNNVNSGTISRTQNMSNTKIIENDSSETN